MYSSKVTIVGSGGIFFREWTRSRNYEANWHLASLVASKVLFLELNSVGLVDGRVAGRWILIESGGRTVMFALEHRRRATQSAHYQAFRAKQPVFDESGQIADESAQNVIFRLLSASWKGAAGARSR
jgi:hypothetical protein